MSDTFVINQAETYLEQLERYIQELDYIRHQLRDRLERYRYDDDPPARIDLQGSIAHFEKFVLPSIFEKQERTVSRIENARILTLGIDGGWGVYDFKQLFDSIDYLGKFYTVDYKLVRDSPDFRIGRRMTRSYVYRGGKLYYYISPREELRVRRMEFSSPGLINFEGVGEVIRELRATIDYIITGQWVKGIIDTYYSLKNREINRETRRYEELARLAEARSRIAKADAERARSIYQQIESHSLIKEAIRQTRQQDLIYRTSDPEKTRRGLQEFERLSDTIVQLEANGLASMPKVEDSLMSSTSKLHRLGYEQQKVKTANTLERAE